MENVIVRAARPEDVPAISAINAAGAPGVSPLTDSEIKAIAAGDIRCWVAEVGRRVVGYLIAYAASDVYDGEEFGWFQGQCPSFLYVDQIAIAPSSRSGGVGSRLYRIVEDAALAQGYGALTCEVNLEPPNLGSLAFHRRLGFVEVGRMSVHDGRTVALLRREVAPRTAR